jgi:hypothetical protein
MKSFKLWTARATGIILVFLPACAPADYPDTHTDESKASSTRTEEVVAKPSVAASTGLPQRIQAAIAEVEKRELLTTNSFWTVFHGILGLGPSAMLRDPTSHERVNALDYICRGGEIRGLQFIPDGIGLEVRTGPQYVGQGHQDQFIAEMAQWGLPADRKFIVQGKDYTFMDFVRHSAARTRINGEQELSWSVLIVGQYLGVDAEWTNAHGDRLSLEDLVRAEVAAPVEQGACGGTHSLFGLTWVYHLHLARGGRTTGVWQEVDNKLHHYQSLARQYQNSDGYFSTNFFKGPGKSTEIDLRINTTGHILEWLALWLPDSELKATWIEDAANSLAILLLQSGSVPLDSGGLYHAIHGLRIYLARLGVKRESDHMPAVPLKPQG